jgi:hypothetical protein
MSDFLRFLMNECLRNTLTPQHRFQFGKSAHRPSFGTRASSRASCAPRQQRSHEPSALASIVMKEIEPKRKGKAGRKAA